MKLLALVRVNLSARSFYINLLKFCTPKNLFENHGGFYLYRPKESSIPSVGQMVTKGHHTCKKDGGREFVLKNAPFLAEHKPLENDPKKRKLQFLGQGYYFWDNHLEMAKIWGKVHCANQYFILECDLDISESKCFDLVGNRSHQIFLLTILDRLKSKGMNKDNWDLSKCIEYLKRMADFDPTIFPFESIRAIDYLPPQELKQLKIAFLNKGKNFTILNPKIAICCLKKDSLNLQTLKIVCESEKGK